MYRQTKSRATVGAEHPAKHSLIGFEATINEQMQSNKNQANNAFSSSQQMHAILNSPNPDIKAALELAKQTSRQIDAMHKYLIRNLPYHRPVEIDIEVFESITTNYN